MSTNSVNLLQVKNAPAAALRGWMPAGLVAASFLSALLMTGCRARAAATAPPPPPPPSVAVSAVESGQPQFESKLPGELRPYQDVDVQARVEGFVKTMLVDRGATVRSGQLLAVIEAPDLVAKRAAAEQRLSAARAQRVQAQAALARDQGTLKRLQDAAASMEGAVAGNDLNIAAQTVAADQAEVAARAAAEGAAERDLTSVEAIESYLRVTAPFAGVIVRRAASPGTLAGPSKTPLFQLQQLDPLRLVVDVPEAQIAGIKTGAKVKFTVITHPGETFEGTVARIADSLRPATRTMPVELDVPNPGLKLAPGMYARVDWHSERSYSTLFVPSSAVVTTTQSTFVERVHDNKIEWVPVQQGFVLPDRTEVFGPLQPGDTVVVQGSEELRPGTVVQPRRGGK